MKGLCMRTSVIWRRPDLQFPPCFDTIFFDIDGVLIKTTASFRAADIAVAAYVAGTIHGLDWGQQEGKQLITLEDVSAFKQAGGANYAAGFRYKRASCSAGWVRGLEAEPVTGC